MKAWVLPLQESHYLLPCKVSTRQKIPFFPLHLLQPGRCRVSVCADLLLTELALQGNRGWLTCRVRQRCVGGLPGAVGGYWTCTAVSVPRRVQRGADVQVQLLSLEQGEKVQCLGKDLNRRTDLVNVALNWMLTFTEEGAISGGDSSSKPNARLLSARTSA